MSDLLEAVVNTPVPFGVILGFIVCGIWELLTR